MNFVVPLVFTDCTTVGKSILLKKELAAAIIVYAIPALYHGIIFTSITIWQALGKFDNMTQNVCSPWCNQTAHKQISLELYS